MLNILLNGSFNLHEKYIPLRREIKNAQTKQNSVYNVSLSIKQNFLV